ncbi:hypothetical protein ES705_26394 [subsurface metagenome]
MKCPKCKGTKYIKAGKIKNNQRYKCIKCNYHYTVITKSSGKSSEIKRLGIELYLEGLGINSIARILQVSHVAIQKWIKKYGNELSIIKNDGSIQIIDIKDLEEYIINKAGEIEYGILLIEIKENSSNSFWILGNQKEVRAYGKKSRIESRGRVE